MAFRKLIEALARAISKRDVDALLDKAFALVLDGKLSSKDHDAFCEIAGRYRNLMPV